MQSLKSPYTLYNQQSVGSTLHNNLLFITDTTFLVGYGNNLCIHDFTSFLSKFRYEKSACSTFPGKDKTGTFTGSIPLVMSLYVW